MRNFDTGCTTNLSRWVLLALAAIALAGCGGEGTQENAPPTAGASAAPTTSTSTSTSTTSNTTTTTTTASVIGNATVSWLAPTENTDGSALTNLAGFRIYYGTNSASLTQSVQVAIGIQTYVVENLSAGTWYFAVKAYTSAGVESDLSNLASKTIS